MNKCPHDWKFAFHITGRICVRIDDCRLCGWEREVRTRMRDDGSFGKGRVKIRPRKEMR